MTNPQFAINSIVAKDLLTAEEFRKLIMLLLITLLLIMILLIDLLCNFVNEKY